MANQTQSVAATRNEPLVTRARQRQHELETALAIVAPGNGLERDDIERALLVVAQLLTGDPDHLAESTACELNVWLERTKYLAYETPMIHSAD